MRKTFVKIFLALIFAMLLGLLFISCKSVVPISSVVDRSDSTSSTTDHNTVKKDSANYRYEVLLRMLNRAQTTVALTRNQVDSLFYVLQILPRGTTITKTDPKLQAQIEILIDSVGRLQLTCISNERYYTETITTQSHYIKELESKLQQQATITTESKTEVKEVKKTFWQQAESFFVAGGTWMLIGLFSLLAFTLLRKRS